MEKETVINEEIKEEEIVEEAKSKMKFIDKLKSKKVLIGVGLLVVAGLAIKAITSMKSEDADDEVIDVEYTECYGDNTLDDSVKEIDQMESTERDE